MEVCLVVHQFLPRFVSGTELYTLRLGKALRAAGHGVRIFAGEPSLSEDPRFREHDGEVEGLPTRYLTASPGLGPNRVLAEYDRALVARRFRAFLDETRPDVVHFFHLMHLGIGLIEEARLFGVPSLVQLMDFWPLCPRATLLRVDGSTCDGPSDIARCIQCMEKNRASGYDLLAEDSVDDADHSSQLIARRGLRSAALLAAHGRPTVVRAALELADALVAPTRSLRELFLANGYSDRIRVIGHAVDDELAPDPTRMNGGSRFGFVGSPLPHKGPDLLLRAFAALDWPEARLTLHGNPDIDPSFGAALRAAASRDARVRLAGQFPPDGLTAALREIDVLVIPSIWRENAPFVVLEAAAAGVPTVCSRIEGLQEVASEGAGSLFFECGDRVGLTAAMQRFRDEPGLIDRMRGELPRVKRMSENAKEMADLYERVRLESTSGITMIEPSRNRAEIVEREETLLRRNAVLEQELLWQAQAFEQTVERLHEVELRNRKLERSLAQRLILALSRMVRR